jgi:hypothetical protein
MKAAKWICRVVGCNATIASPGYCPTHKRNETDRFKDLGKAPGSRAFYSGMEWRRTSLAFRELHPLCAEHEARGMIRQADLVDHIEEREALIARGEDPYDFKYLRSLCHACHNRKLRERQSRTRGNVCIH